MDEALTVKTQHLNDTKFITKAGFSSNLSLRGILVKVDLAILAYPHGQCFRIRPPPGNGNSTEVISTLFLDLNVTQFNRSKDITAKIYFMAQASSLEIYPQEHDMAGHPLKVRLNGQQMFISTFRTEISKSHHVPGDPLLDCTEYKQKSA